MIGMGRGRRNFRVHARGRQASLRQHRVVIAMDDVMRDTGMVRLLLEHRFEDFAASPLIRKRLVGFGRGDGERQRVENRSLVIVGVSGLHFAHFLFECPGVRGGVLAVFRVSLSQRFNI